jgi:hypothetical protein
MVGAGEGGAFGRSVGQDIEIRLAVGASPTTAKRISINSFEQAGDLVALRPGEKLRPMGSFSLHGRLASPDKADPSTLNALGF